MTRSGIREFVPRGCRPTLLAAGLLCALAGCQPDDEHRRSVQHTTERGPLRMHVEAWPTELVVGDSATIEVTVEAPEDYTVELPTAEAFDPLDVRILRTADPQPGQTGIVHQRTYEIDTNVSGRLDVPALTTRYQRQATYEDNKPPAANELVSEPLTLSVASVLTESDTPTDPRDITGTMTPPKPPWPTWVWALITSASLTIISAIVMGIWYLVWRSKLPPPPILPEVWALRELASLDNAEWLHRDRLRPLYYRLTEVVRRYIELKFELAAPEMTTEEFLATLARNEHALPYDADRLRAFLEACDYVKYAAVDPHPDDAREVLSTARTFVHATAAAADQARRAEAPHETTPQDDPAGGQAA